MARFNIKSLTNRICHAIISLIGDELSVIGHSREPSVFIAGRVPPKPSYPYVVVDYNYSPRTSLTNNVEYSDHESGNFKVDNYKNYSFQVDIYGNEKGDANGLSEYLLELLNTETGMGKFHDATGEVFTYTSGSTSIRNPLVNSFEEMASFEIVVPFIVTHTDEKKTMDIIKIDVEGDLDSGIINEVVVANNLN